MNLLDFNKLNLGQIMTEKEQVISEEVKNEVVTEAKTEDAPVEVAEVK